MTLFAFRYDPASAAGLLIPHFRVTFRPDSPAPICRIPSGEIFAFVVGKNFAASPALKRYQAFKESLGYHVETIEVAARMLWIRLGFARGSGRFTRNPATR